jgi:uncharacterized protein (TIGR03790 family)
MQARGIPAANRIELAFPVTGVMGLSDFNAARAQVLARLDGGLQALALTWTSPYRVDCMSVTSAFALGFDAGAYCNTTSPFACAATASVPTYNSRSHRLATDFGVLPAMMIASRDAGAAVALIDRGVASDGTNPVGDGYFWRTTDSARSVRFFDFQQTVAAFAGDGGLALRYLDNVAGDAGTNFLQGAADVLFYFTGLADVPGIATNSYRPGAVADHLTSYGGQVPTSGQMSALRWLEAGATASYGTVVEPCNFTSKFPQTSVLLPHYFRGEPIIEAYWKSVSMPGEGLFIGEPLARPFYDDPFAWDAATATLTVETNSLIPARSYAIEAADAPDGPWDHVQDEAILVAQRATIEVLNATRAHYRLVER